MNSDDGVIRKNRDHPFTQKLNQIKSKICYYNKKLNEEKDEDKKKKIQNVIDELNYTRFILKLNKRDIDVLQKICIFNEIEIDIIELREKYR